MVETMQDLGQMGVAAPKIEEKWLVAQPSLAEAATAAGGVDGAAGQAVVLSNRGRLRYAASRSGAAVFS